MARTTIYRWKREGVNVQDAAAVAARVAAMGGKAVSPSVTLPSVAQLEPYAEARRRREVANADRAETLAARERGELIEAASIRHQGEAIGRAVRDHFDRLANSELPPRLAGRDAAEIAAILREVHRDVLNDLSDRDPLFPSNHDTHEPTG